MPPVGRPSQSRGRGASAPFREGPHAHGLPVQQVDGLLHATEAATGPSVGKVACGHFRDDRSAVLAGLFQDVQGPKEIDVRRLAGLDLLRRGDVEVATGRILGHRLPSGYFLCVLEPFVLRANDPYPIRPSCRLVSEAGGTLSRRHGGTEKLLDARRSCVGRPGRWDRNQKRVGNRTTSSRDSYLAVGHYVMTTTRKTQWRRRLYARPIAARGSRRS